jgi:hypothetical protein
MEEDAGAAVADAGLEDFGPDNEEVAQVEQNDVGVVAAGVKRKREYKLRTAEDLMAMRQNRLQSFDSIVSQAGFACVDKSSAAKLKFGDKCTVHCLACKCDISMIGGTGNVFKHNKSDK